MSVVFALCLDFFGGNMKVQRTAILLIVGILFLGAADHLLAEPLSSQFFQDEAKLPKSFRVSRSKSSIYIPLKVLHNPLEEIYVVFILEQDVKTHEIYVYSRTYNKKGKPKGPFFRLLPIYYRVAADEAPKYTITFVDVCYNPDDNKFFLIWNYSDFDGIYGMDLNERGNREGVTTWTYSMKKRLDKQGTGFSPMIDWDAGKGQYVMGWTYIDLSSNNKNNPKNGYYLATFTPFLTPKKAMKKVRSIRIINTVPFLTEFFVAGNKLFWGTFESIDETWRQPVVWLTKVNGKNLSPEPVQDAGPKYPGKKFKNGGVVRAGYDPTNDHFLLTWNSYEEDSSYVTTYSQNHYRVMDGKGNFIGKEQIVPQVENFQSGAYVTYDLNDEHFFLTCAEYKIFDEPYTASSSPLLDGKSMWGGRIWGYKIDGMGKQIGNRIPLTKVFSDNNTSLGFSTGYFNANSGAYYNAYDDQHFMLYYLVNNSAYISKAFGLIYK